jgi:molybdopterin converting factor small subunit
MEFLGVSRLVIGERTLSLDVEDGMTFRELVRLLGERYPGLIGDVIEPDGESLQAPNVFNLNARQMIQDDQMDAAPGDGDRIILMSMAAGG